MSDDDGDKNIKLDNGLFAPLRLRINKEQNKLLPVSDSLTRLPASIEVNRKNGPRVPLVKNYELDTYVYIDVEVNNIDDILKLVRKYPIRPHTKYNINMVAIHNISDALTRLNSMVGLHKLKDSIVDQIIYYIQNFHKLGNDEKDFLHTVIYGPPGTGKTEIAKIIGEIFSKLGILQSNVFKKVTRADLIAGYLGQTAIKTRKVIEECLGGVLFIDEAYALGNNEKSDSFSKECIDTLCEALSDHKDELMIIIAGYENELKKCFFGYNEGLESRFVWRFSTEEYSPQELREIFIKKVKDANWSISGTIPAKWFEKHRPYFKYFGRDIETLFAKTKICHSRRVFCKPTSMKTKINFGDLKNGLKLYLKNDDRKIALNDAEYMYI